MGAAAMEGEITAEADGGGRGGAAAAAGRWRSRGSTEDEVGDEVVDSRPTPPTSFLHLLFPLFPSHPRLLPLEVQHQRVVVPRRREAQQRRVRATPGPSSSSSPRPPLLRLRQYLWGIEGGERDGQGLTKASGVGGVEGVAVGVGGEGRTLIRLRAVDDLGGAGVDGEAGGDGGVERERQGQAG